VLLAFGHLPDGYLGLGAAMRAMGRPQEARQALEQGAARFPAEPQLPHDLARLAEERRDWPEAERRWRQALALRQDCPAAAGLARALFVQGRGSEAAAELQRYAPVVLAADPQWLAHTAVVMSENWSPALRPLMLEVERALEAHAGEAATHQVCLAYARAAWHRGDPRSFRERAEGMSRRFAGDVMARRLILEARELAPQDGDDRRDDAVEGDEFGRFESLGGGGDRGGCEFGFLQRMHGLEPLSLLRWASIEPEGLAEALERRFEGLGEPGAIEVEAQPSCDWRASDLVYGIRMDHTHLDRGAVDAADAVRQISMRLQFLKRKLLADLAEADKVFVYRMAGAGVPAELLLRFSRALAAYGDALMVVVCENGAGPQTVYFDHLAPNLLVASREDFGGPAPRTLEEAAPSWREICGRALERQRGRRELSTAEVALRFESLGGGGMNSDGWGFGCEFGFFQRHSGVEPLGLLRWASIPPDELIRALQRRFEGIDDPAQLELVEHSGRDWGVVHRLWKARFDHSGLDRDEIGREEALRRVVRSFVLLRRKLLEDLAAAEKIFVYRCYDHVLSDATLDRLVAALGSYGDATLLYVAEAAAGDAPLTVERRGPRLLYGRIDRFAPQNHQLIYNDSGWEAVCRAALKEHERAGARSFATTRRPLAG
jgi:hypothetical protein